MTTNLEDAQFSVEVAEAYAAENPSVEVERAKRFKDACRANPEPSEPSAFLEWTYALLWSHAYYRDVLFEHFGRRPRA